jgi:NAD(P)-dependent dehydrogenase (short-subunit alcohol dehydrogenase family)
MAAENADKGIRVKAMAPGITMTQRVIERASSRFAASRC